MGKTWSILLSLLLMQHVICKFHRLFIILQEIIENHMKMATSKLKASLILLALFAILLLACATSDNKTKQPLNNMVGDLVMRLSLIRTTTYVNFFKDVHEKMAY